MNKFDKAEKEKRVNELIERDNELKEAIKVNNNVEELKTLDKERTENAAELIKLQNELKEDPKPIVKEAKNNMDYLKTNNAVNDFLEIIKNNKAENKAKVWEDKLVKNGITITDETLQLPRKIVESIQSSLLETNEVFKAFKVTTIGALIVSQTFESDDKALVHVPGTQKTVQAATLDIDSLKPVMVYKLQMIGELVKRLNANYQELYAMVVAELTQAIVNKIVDLALVLGDGTNGFISVEKETNAKKVKKITAAATGDTPLADAVEDAVDFVRPTQGAKYLIVTSAQRRQLLNELRKAVAPARVRNTDVDIASEVGVDGILVYNGTEALKPTLLVQDGYHVDMQDMTKIDAFKWETNENAILLETVTNGHIEKYKSAAVITVAEA